MKKTILRSLFLLIIAFPLERSFGQQSRSSDELLVKEKIEKVRQIIDSANSASTAMKALGTDTTVLERAYPFLMARYPHHAEIPYTIAAIFQKEKSPKAYPYLEKTVAMEPKMTSAWLDMAALAYNNNDFVAQSAYLNRGRIANPKNPELAYAYALTLSGGERRSFFLKIGNSFADTEMASKAFTWLALSAEDMEEKIKYFEKVKSIYLQKRYRVSADAMNTYYTVLLEYDVKKTIPLLQELLKIKFRSDDWGLLLKVSHQVMMVDDLLVKQRGDQALEILENIKIPYFASEPKDFLLCLKAKAIAIAQGKEVAYNRLIDGFIQKSPGRKIYNEILAYGMELKKEIPEIRREIIAALNKNTRKATGFKLKKSMSGDSVSLDASKGKVVLLSYWFPKCIPCRAEFVTFEKILSKIEAGRVDYLAINIVPKQEQEVPALVRAKAYSFTSLEEKQYRNKGNMNNMGIAPANFLIGKDGNLAFENFRINESNGEDLALMIGLLL